MHEVCKKIHNFEFFEKKMVELARCKTTANQKYKNGESFLICIKILYQTIIKVCPFGIHRYSVVPATFLYKTVKFHINYPTKWKVINRYVTHVVEEFWKTFNSLKWTAKYKTTVVRQRKICFSKCFYFSCYNLAPC